MFWHEENSCDFVPSAWAVNDEKTYYLFPTNVSRKTITNLIQNCVDPSSTKHRFTEHRASYKKTVTNLEAAEKLIEKAMDTDNFDNEDDASNSDYTDHLPLSNLQSQINEGIKINCIFYSFN